MKRVSRKKADELAKLRGYRLVPHEWCGKTDYYYDYSLVKDNERGEYDKTILRRTTLKEIYSFLIA